MQVHGAYLSGLRAAEEVMAAAHISKGAVEDVEVGDDVAAADHSDDFGKR
jgi:hypothetical protein